MTLEVKEIDYYKKSLLIYAQLDMIVKRGGKYSGDSR
jgi:hypothetical protein